MVGYYYLHSETKDLIYKPASVVWSDSQYFDSPFVQKVWEFDSEDRFDAWRVCVEASVLGAKKSRINELASKWGLTDEDGLHFLERAKLTGTKDGNEWCIAHLDDTDCDGHVNIQESQAGFGKSILEALIEYAKQGSLVKE